MNKRIFRISVLLTALFLSLANFTSCDFNPDDTTEKTTPSEISKAPLLIGKWEASNTSSDKLVITETTVTSYWDASIYFEGTIKNVRLLTENSGYITLLITKNEAGWGAIIGNYYVIHFKDLSANSVKEAAPYKDATTENNGLATQAEAEETYTVTNGYYAIFSDYIKQ